MSVAVQENTKKVFLSGVLLLTLSTLLVKLIGLIYKIPMLSYLGSEGMGYFNSAYEIYALFCVISTAGLPVALSVLISGAIARGERGSVRRIYRSALTVFWIIGALGSVLMLLLADRFCGWIQSEGAYFSILAIAPTLLFVCLSSALRGYFQGYQRMLPTAISQVIESLGKLVFGLLLAGWALERGYDTARVSAFAGIGLTLGTMLSFFYLWIEKRRFCPNEEENCEAAVSRADVFRRLARLSLPMTLGASLVSFTKLIDMAMILRRLQAIGYSETAANEAYGGYTTLALSVFGLLPSLVNSVALPLVPMLSAAIASGDRARQSEMIRASYRLTALLAIPAALGVAAYAHPVLSLLFAGEEQVVALAAPLLSALGVSVFLSCMITATGSVLHAYQAVNRPTLSMLAGALVKILSAYFLIGNPQIALMGAPISTFLCDAVVVLLNLRFSDRLCRVEGLGPVFWKPLLAAALSVGGSYSLYLWVMLRFGASSMLTLMAISAAGALYLLFACLTGMLEEADFSLLPMGKQICKILKQLRLLPRENNRSDFGAGE